MAKTNQEFVAGLAEKLASKMRVIQQADSDREEIMTAVCEAETVLCILKDFLELEKEKEKQSSYSKYRGSESSDDEDDYEDEDTKRSTKKDTTY